MYIDPRMAENSRKGKLGVAAEARESGRKPAPKLALAKQRGRRRSQVERRDASKEGLLSAALALIAERGFRATSLHAIGVRAGYSPSLVSHRFGSKEGLLRELVLGMLDRWGTDVRDPAVADRTGVAALEAIAATHRQAVTLTPDAVRALYMLLFDSMDKPELRAEFAQLDGRMREGIERLLVAGVASGNVRADADTSAQSVLFLAVLRGIALQWLVDPASLDLERVYSALDRLLEHGLTP
jgi:AcrR family transcriptional regulator